MMSPLLWVHKSNWPTSGKLFPCGHPTPLSPTTIFLPLLQWTLSHGRQKFVIGDLFRDVHSPVSYSLYISWPVVHFCANHHLMHNSRLLLPSFHSARRCYSSYLKRNFTNFTQLCILSPTTKTVLAKHTHWCDNVMSTTAVTNCFLIGFNLWFIGGSPWLTLI